MTTTRRTKRRTLHEFIDVNAMYLGRIGALVAFAAEVVAATMTAVTFYDGQRVHSLLYGVAGVLACVAFFCLVRLGRRYPRAVDLGQAALPAGRHRRPELPAPAGQQVRGGTALATRSMILPAGADADR